jgi:hypothetical protein
MGFNKIVEGFFMTRQEFEATFGNALRVKNLASLPQLRAVFDSFVDAVQEDSDGNKDLEHLLYAIHNAAVANAQEVSINVTLTALETLGLLEKPS